MNSLIKYLGGIAACIAVIILSRLSVSADSDAPLITETVSSETEELPEVTTENDPSEETQQNEGWNKIDDKWFYYSEDSFVTGTQLIDGEYYVFAANGAFRGGWQTVNSIRRYYDRSSHSLQYGWISEYGYTYYHDKEQGKLTGMQSIGENTFIFSNSGIMQTGFTIYGEDMYYCNENGEVVFGDSSGNPVKIGENYHIITPQGRVMRGWQTVNGLQLFYDYQTGLPVYGWVYDNERSCYYYIDNKEGKYTGIHYIDDRPYRFDEEGVMQTGFQSFDRRTACYYYDDHTAATGFVTIESDTYYFDNNGYMLIDWQNIEGDRYYFSYNGKMQKGLLGINSNVYYFNNDGKMQKYWQTIDGYKYYFGYDGKARTGWQTISGSKYYFNSDGRVTTKWKTIGKEMYYFGTDGKMRTGFRTIGKDTYYFGTDGAMKKGLQIVDGKYYNMGTDGKQKPIKVFVGVGHGGSDGGAVGYIVEKEYTLKTAKIVEKYLKEAGVGYMLSRTEDIDTTMEGKLKQCSDYDPDIIIDIHFNAVGGHGFSVYYSQYGGMSLTLAQNINARASKLMYSNGCKTYIVNGKDRFTIIRETHAPAVLIEGGYVDNAADAQFIRSNYQKLGEAYAKGILETLKKLLGYSG